MTDSPSMAQDSYDESYRSVSTTALTALALGLISAIAFLAPLLMIVPCAGVIVAIAALREIGASGQTKLGRPFALAGFAMALVCLTGAGSQRYASARLVTVQATPVAQRWFELLRQRDLQQAYFVTLDPIERRRLLDQASSARKSGDSSEEIAQAITTFSQEPHMKRFLTITGWKGATLISSEKPQFFPKGNIHIQQRYRLQTLSNERVPDYLVRLERLPPRKRSEDRSSASSWRVIKMVEAHP